MEWLVQRREDGGKPFTAIAALPKSDAQPVILVVEPDGRLATFAAEICHFLRIEVMHVPDPDSLRTVLHRQHPIGVLTDAGPGGESGCRTLRAVAGYDRNLPIMMVNAGDPETLGRLDAMEDICALGAVKRSSGRLAARDLVDFLFVAGRRSGTGRLMPV